MNDSTAPRPKDLRRIPQARVEPAKTTGSTEFDDIGDAVVGIRTEAPTRGVIRPLHPSFAWLHPFHTVDPQVGRYSAKHNLWLDAME